MVRTEEYKGYYIQIRQGEPELMTGERYWQYSATPLAQNDRTFQWNGKQFGGYEVALDEAKKFVDGINQNY
jgi:hypothetical protein